LVEYNKILNETLKEMIGKDRNEEMMVKTKLYVSDIQNYRNSQG
jgi:phosphate starvation-inducible protein PhoH